GDHEHHDGRQGVETERDVGGEATGGDPVVDVVPEGGLRAEAPQRLRTEEREPERAEHQPRADDLHGRRHPAPEKGVEQHAEGRQRDDPAEKRGLGHHLSDASSSAFVVSRFRNMAMMIARPTAASAAATVMTKNTITCPSIEPWWRAMATNARLTAFSMISMAMKMTMTFRRDSTPNTPMENRAAESQMYQSSGATPQPFFRASTTAPTMATSNR